MSDCFSLAFESITSGIAQGSFNYIVEVVPTGNSEAASTIKSKAVRAIGSDPVLEWNAIALNAIEASGKEGIGIPPTEGSRMLAIMSTAVFDTVNAFSNQYESYAIDRAAPKGASLNAAIAGAAFRVLKELLPNQTSFLRQEKNRFLRRNKESDQAEILGFDFGRSMANASLKLRSGDGSEKNEPLPTGNPNDYFWQPDPENGTAVSSHWGKVRPLEFQV
ncbi:MAG: hypothetical protein HC810_06390 [Acaryochloridaceae cyanobacterium RL_2_7]|nr:hypothetical protein [Acaryochloridaceae cyanobacterium RL_2_7]